jgi:uncharacterized protein YqjF (DUF2071 family)
LENRSNAAESNQGATPMQQFLFRTSNRPRPLPPGRWMMTQRWNDLLLAQWPLPAQDLAVHLPPELQPDLWQGSAWIGVAPYWVDHLRFRGLPALPGGRRFPGLSLRAWVRDRQTGAPGLYLFSLETNSLVAFTLGCTIYQLPYHLAEMNLQQRREREFEIYSRRRFVHRNVLFKARYRGLGPTLKLAEMRSGSLESFLMERTSVFTQDRGGGLVRSQVHHVTSPLEEAEATIEYNDLPAAVGLRLPVSDPVLYYVRRMALYIWPRERVGAAVSARPVPVAVPQS